MEALRKSFLEEQSQRCIKDKLLSKLMISPENIAYSVFPIAEAIHEIRPDYMLALDRGGRIVGLATYMMYRELYGSLPTNDRVMHFQKISRRLPPVVVYERLKPIAKEVLSVKDSPKVFVIDDWMNTGITRSRINQAFKQLSDNRITVYYGVLRGRGENVTGDRVSMAYCTWHGNTNQIGIEYSEKTGITKSAHSSEAIVFRNRLYKNIKDFAAKISEQK